MAKNLEDLEDKNTKVIVRVSPVSEGDLEEVYQIELECFGRDAYPKLVFNYLLRNPRSIFLKATIDNILVGFIAGLCHRDECLLYTLNVKKDFRRMGIGSILLEALEKKALELNMKKIVLQVEVTNSPAVNLYLKKGYSITRMINNYYGYRRDAYEACKLL